MKNEWEENKYLKGKKLKLRSTGQSEQREEQLVVTVALDLRTRVVQDDLGQGVQSHLTVLETLCLLAGVTGVHLLRREGHEGVEVLGLGTQEVQ